MSSFDVVCEVNMMEVESTVEQVNKEISTRFDLKGSDFHVGHKKQELTLFADDGFKTGQVNDVLMDKLVRHNVDAHFLNYQNKQEIGGDKMRQVVKTKKGVSGDLVRKIVKTIENGRIEVQASIQGDAMRVTGAKCDNLQSAIVMLRKDVSDTSLDFNNSRD